LLNFWYSTVQAKVEADRKAKEEADRKTKEDADRRANIASGS
jgi:hypothetical protein